MPSAPKGIPNAVTKTLICVETVEDADFSGILYNPYWPLPVPFTQMKDILHTLEHFFDQIDYPQADYRNRSFVLEPEHKLPDTIQPLVRYADDSLFAAHRGRVATLAVHVQLRKHATWQGELYLLDTGQRSVFHSTLEMILMLDAAVAVGQAQLG